MQQNWGPPAPPQYQPAPASIPNYMVMGILATLFCLPMGALALNYAAKVNKLIAVGDIRGAMEASANAKKWSYISVGIGVAIILVAVLAMIAFYMFSGSTPRRYP